MIKAIMYHYVRKYDKQLPYFTFLHFDDFCRQLDYLQQHFNIINPAQLPAIINSGQPTQGVILTFDDGLKDHYQHVFPELKRRGLSAIFYISTGVFNAVKLLNVHRMHMLLGKVGGAELYKTIMKVVTPEMLSNNHEHEYKSFTYRYQQNDDATQRAKRMLNFYISYHFRQQVLDTLMAYYFSYEKAVCSDFYVTPGQVKEMHCAGMIIGSHTVSHPVLSKLSAAEQNHEIVSSLGTLQQVTGGLHHRTFCYPHGGNHTFNHDTERILSENKFSYSFSVEPREVSLDDLQQRPYALPRFDCNMFPHGKIYAAARQPASIAMPAFS